MQNIICFIDSNERYLFFSRVNSVLKNDFNTELIFVTNKLSTFLLAKFKKNKIFLVQKTKKNTRNNNIQKTLEFKINYLDKYESEQLYSAEIETLEKIVKNQKVIGILNWNGGTIHNASCRAIAKKHKLPILFAEIANFKDKLFFDKIGTNSDSSIAKNKELLFQYSSNEKEYAKWKKEFVESRINLSKIPQAKAKNYKQIFCSLRNFVLDEIGYLFGITIRSNLKPVDNLSRILKCKKLNKKLSSLYSYKLPKGFVFLPLQTSEDTNLILRSKIGNLEAIDKVKKFAESEKLPLVIKTHPADKNDKFLKELYDYLIKNPDIIITNKNAFLLARESKYCFTINSTLGLEAKICGVNVKTLGNTLYDGWTEEHIKHYITGFLIEMPYFDYNVPISTLSVKKLLERLLK